MTEQEKETERESSTQQMEKSRGSEVYAAAIVPAGRRLCQKGWMDEAEMDVRLSDRIMYLQDLGYVRLLSCHSVPECMQADNLCFARDEKNPSISVFAFSVGTQAAMLHEERNKRASSAAFTPLIYLIHTRVSKMWRFSRGPDSVRDVL